jgi:hypothetical protein
MSKTYISTELRYFVYERAGGCLTLAFKYGVNTFNWKKV